MTTERKLEFNRALLGVEAESGRFPVTEGTIHDFCGMVEETNPLYRDLEEARRRGYRGLVAPPTMVNLYVRRLIKPDAKLSFKGTRLHAGQTLAVHQPICAGDVLTAYTQLAEVYAKTGRTGTMAFMVWETRFVNQEEVTVASVRESFMSRP